MKKTAFWLAIALVLGGAGLSAQVGGAEGGLSAEVLTRLQRLPHYGVFDTLSFRLDGNNVTLLGRVLLPITRREAAAQVARVAGVGTVTNAIEVLPLSRADDLLRMQVYRRVFSAEGLYRYALGPDPSIHIIVARGKVTLEGMVSGEMDRKLALMAVRQVPGAFTFQNNLRVGE